jgi:formylglycine-generating enzyme required for sulfatase activity
MAVYDAQGRKHAMDEAEFPALVSWSQANAFCQWLSAKVGQTVRLPTEEEWEYACRAGSQTRFYWGDDASVIGLYANVADLDAHDVTELWDWFPIRDGSATLDRVARRKSNGYGLFDMIGNASEWTVEKKQGASAGSDSLNDKVLHFYRGGSWQSGIKSARCASRQGQPDDGSPGTVGFRVLVEMHGPSANQPIPSNQVRSEQNPWSWLLIASPVAILGLWLLRMWVRSPVDLIAKRNTR